MPALLSSLLLLAALFTTDLVTETRVADGGEESLWAWSASFCSKSSVSNSLELGKVLNLSTGDWYSFILFIRADFGEDTDFGEAAGDNIGEVV